MPANTTTLAELIVQLYKGPWVEALYTNTFLLTRIQQKQGVGEGVRWPVRYAGNTSAGSYAEGDSGAGAGNQGFKKAFLTWKLNKVEVIGIQPETLNQVVNYPVKRQYQLAWLRPPMAVPRSFV